MATLATCQRYRQMAILIDEFIFMRRRCSNLNTGYDCCSSGVYRGILNNQIICVEERNMEQLEMDVLGTEGVKCRICLEENVVVHWGALLYGDSDLTYKDCFYKYTQLEYDDENNFSTMLCRNCSSGLEYVDAFISKAIESHLILQEKFCIDMITDNGCNIKPEPTNFETILVEEVESLPENENFLYGDTSEDYLTISAENNATSRSETRIKQTSKQKKHESLKLNKTKVCLNSTDHIKKKGNSICCTICSKVLASKYSAIIHEKTHIKNRERNETCVECGLKFFSKEILRSHMLTHIENREKAHKCEFCDKAFFNKGGLNVHRRIHLGQMVPCSLCTKQFYRQIDLDIHMASHSEVSINSTIKTKRKCFIRCQDCGKSIRSNSFKDHNAKHMNEPLYKCSVCDKEFFNRSSCAKHLKRTHKRANGDNVKFIIAYKKNRLSHLYLQQNTNIEVNHE